MLPERSISYVDTRSTCRLDCKERYVPGALTQSSRVSTVVFRIFIYVLSSGDGLCTKRRHLLVTATVLHDSGKFP